MIRKQYNGIRLIIAVSFLVLLAGFTACNKKAIPSKTTSVHKELSGKELKNYNYLFSEALKEKVLGNMQKAGRYYTECLKINPRSDASMYELSTLYTMGGDYKLGLQYGNMAMITDPDNIWYQLNMANLYHTVEMYDSSIAVYERILKKFPERTDLYFSLANIYKESGKYKEAISIFNEIEKKYGYQANIAMLREEIYEGQKDFEKAEKELDKLIRTFPEEMKYQILLAELFYKKGDSEAAEKQYDIVEFMDPENNLLLLSKITFYRKTNNYKEAFILIDTLIVRERVNPETKVQLVVSLLTNPEEINKYPDEIFTRVEVLKKMYPNEIRYYALLGDFYVKIENYQKASEEFRAYIEKDKTNYRVWEQLLYIENVLGNTDKLYILSNEAMSFFQNAPVLYFFHAIACTEMKRYEEALEVLQKGITFAGGNKELVMQFYSLLGEAYKNVGKNVLSDQAFENALEIDPENILVLNNYSYYLSLRGQDLKKALKMSSITIKAEPNNSTYLDTYGWILFKLKRYQDALKYLKKAIENDESPSGEILEHYGDVLYKTGEKEEAVKYWSDALNYSDNKDKLKKKIENATK